MIAIWRAQSAPTMVPSNANFIVLEFACVHYSNLNRALTSTEEAGESSNSSTSNPTYALLFRPAIVDMENILGALEARRDQ